MREAEYDRIAKDYQASKQLPFRVYAEQPLLFALLGEVRGKRVLDLGCGEGIYARRLKAEGARQVTGVDLSAEMIALARQRESAAPLGIDYQVGDAATIGRLGSFDVVLGSYLLNYARSEDELLGYCRTIAANLKPGGRLVGMNDNPASDPKHYATYRKYGFIKSAPLPRVDGSTITYTFFNEDGSTFHFDNFFLEPACYERAFAAAGFREWAWHRPEVTPAGVEALGDSFWNEFRLDPPVVGISALL